VFETTSDAILLVDAETAIVADANPAAERLYGQPRERLRTLRYDELLDPESPGALPATGARAVPARHRRADGSPFPVELTAGELQLQDRPLRVLSIRDVSERERAEEERRELEQSLRQAQKMEAVGRLAGGVAHDFSNVLAVILGYSEMLMRDLPDGDPRLKESAEGIVEAAHRAAGVTRQLLTLSRKKLLRPEVLSLNKVVTDLGKLLGRAIGERIELTSRLQDGLWPVLADADQLAQVLINLAVNARDAMPDGGPLAIETANVELADRPRDLGIPAGRYVALSVRDGGCGMTDEVRSRIFDPFFTTKQTGTGLGLATSGRRAGRSASSRGWARARPSRCSCRWGRRRRDGSRSPCRRRRRAASARRSCSPRTRTRCACCSGASSPGAATRSSPAGTARRRSRRCARRAAASTSCSRTSSCRG
jgi:PAS domain S-box-containing protein